MAILAILDPGAAHVRDVLRERPGEVREPVTERIRRGLLRVPLSLRTQRRRQPRARLHRHRPDRLLRVRPQFRERAERGAQPRARLPLLGLLLELRYDRVKVRLGGDPRAGGGDRADAPNRRRPSPLVRVLHLRQHAVPQRLHGASIRAVEVGDGRGCEHANDGR